MSYLRLAGPLCIASALMAGEMIGSAPKPAPRNLLLITLDTMRADRLPVYGFQGVETPALDRIAADGLVFEEAYAAVPLTLPSHASILTGLYPPRLGVRDNASPPLSDQFTTLAEALQKHGLRTAAFVASGVLSPGRGLAQGFEHYSDSAPTHCPGAPARRRAGEVTDDALNWLAANGEAPFFVWMHLFDTHRPYDLPDDYKDRHLDPYLDAIAYEDSQIARVLDNLDARGLTQKTVIVVVGDHGESMGGHGEESHGLFVYQEALRVPFIVRGPGVSPRRATSVARLVDVTPTVLNLFGVTATTAMDGVSLAGAGARQNDDPPLEVYAESMYAQRFGWSPLRSLRADRYKLIDASRPELFDLDRDPVEARDIAAEHPAVVDAMRRRLRSFDPQRPSTNDHPVDRSVRERIASLGYVGEARAEPTSLSGEIPDPKDRVDQFNRMTALQWSNAVRRRSLCR